MSVTRIVIEVMERGAKVVQRSLASIGETAARSATGVNALKSALGGLAVGAAVVGLKNLIDTFTSLNNKLKATTGATSDLASGMFQQLLKVSNDTRTSIDDTITVFSRLAKAGTQNGKSLGEMVEFQRSLNQAVAISGATTVEATNALIQFAQGLGKGRLDGEELKSVLEQLPNVADIIADSMGVARSALRKLGEDGKITPQVIFKAFQEAGPKLAAAFAASAPTIGQSFTVLRNSLVVVAGELDKTLGISRGFFQAVMFITNHLKEFAIAAVAVGGAIATYLVGQGINLAIAAMRALTVAIMANPIGALIVVLGGAILSLTVFRDQIMLGVDGVTSLGDMFRAMWEVAGPILSNLIDTFMEWAGPTIGYLLSAFDGVDASLYGMMQLAAKVVDGIVAGFSGAAAAVSTAWSAITTFNFDNVAGNMSAAFSAAFKNSGDDAKNFLSSMKTRAQEIGAERQKKAAEENAKLAAFMAKKDKPGGIQPDGGGKKGGKSQAQKDLEEFERNLEQLTGKYAPNIARANELSETLVTLNKAYALGDEGLKKYGLSQAEVTAMIALANEKLGEAGGVYQTHLKNIKEENSLLLLSNKEREIERELRTIIKEAMEAGTPLKEQELAQLRKELQLKEQLTQQDLLRESLKEKIRTAKNEALLQSVPEADRDFARAQLDFADEVEKSGMSAGEAAGMWKQYEDAVMASRQAVVDFQTNGLGGIQDGFESWVTTASNVRDSFKQLTEQGINKMTDGLVELATTGKFSMDTLKSSLADFSKEIFSASFKGVLGMLLGGGQATQPSFPGSGGGGGGGMLSGILGSLGGGGGGGIASMIGGLFGGGGGGAALSTSAVGMDYGAMGKEMGAGFSGTIGESKGEFAAAGGAMGGGLGGVLSGLFNSIMGLFGGGGGGGGGGAATALGGLAGLGLQAGMMGFATGGDFMVGGNGGTDSQTVAFRATPGEKVSVRTPGQQENEKKDGQAQPAPVPQNIKVVNVMDPAESLAALNSSAGERIIMNVIERNPSLIRRMLDR